MYPCAAFAFHRGQVSGRRCQPCQHADPRPHTADRQETHRLLSADPRAPFITVSLPPVTPFNSAPTPKPGRSPLKRPRPRHSPFISSSEEPPSPPHPRYRFNCFNHPQPVGPPTRLLFVLLLLTRTRGTDGRALGCDASATRLGHCVSPCHRLAPVPLPSPLPAHVGHFLPCMSQRHLTQAVPCLSLPRFPHPRGLLMPLVQHPVSL